MPPRLVQWRAGSPLFDFVFFVRGGASVRVRYWVSFVSLAYIRHYLCEKTNLPITKWGVTDLPTSLSTVCLTHWGRVMHVCIGKLTITDRDNGLSPDRRQAIIWTNAGILLIRTLGTNFSEILIEIDAFSFKKMNLKMSSRKRPPSCLGLNVLNVMV